MNLGGVQLWRLDALSLGDLLLLVKMPSDQPLGSLERHFQQQGDGTNRNDGLGIKSRSLSAVSEEKHLTNSKFSVVLIGDSFHF